MEACGRDFTVACQRQPIKGAVATVPADLFAAVMSRGLSAIRPLVSNRPDSFGWNFGPAQMPSYKAFGRIRALLAVVEAERLAPQRVLEVAAGDAALCATLHRRTGCEVVANDLRENALTAAAATFVNGNEIELLPGNIFDLEPTARPPFDLVIACEIIEHVAHGIDFLKHLRRFLTPTGRILLTTPNGSHFRNKLPGYYDVPDHTALEPQQFKPDADGHLFLIRPAELYRMAHDSDLWVERMLLWGSPFITGHGMLNRLNGAIPQKFCLDMEALFSSWERSLFAISAVLRPV